MRAFIALAVLALTAGSVAFSGPAYAQKANLGPTHTGWHNAEPHAPLTRRAARRTRSKSRSVEIRDMDSVGHRMERWKPVPPDHKRTPDQGSPEWARERAEAAEKDRVLDRKIRSICRGC